MFASTIAIGDETDSCDNLYVSTLIPNLDFRLLHGCLSNFLKREYVLNEDNVNIFTLGYLMELVVIITE